MKLAAFPHIKATKDDKVVVAWLCHGHYLLSTALQCYKMAPIYPSNDPPTTLATLATVTFTTYLTFPRAIA